MGKGIIGIDISEEGISEMKKYGYKDLYLMDAVDIKKLEKKFELIFAGDVLEHMTSPSSFLKVVPNCLTSKGELLLSLPNAYSCSILRYLRAIEPTHFEHCYCFTVKTISHLCERFNLLPVELAFTQQPPQGCESKIQWNLKNLLIRMKPKMAPTLMIKFRLKESINFEKFAQPFLKVIACIRIINPIFNRGFQLFLFLEFF
ncbi:MAG: methyltransferase domain-containing protein [Candidatus Jordarchaeaceae archaeon]